MEYAFILLLAYASYLSVEKYVHTGSLLAWRGRPAPPAPSGEEDGQAVPPESPDGGITGRSRYKAQPPPPDSLGHTEGRHPASVEGEAVPAGPDPFGKLETDGIPERYEITGYVERPDPHQPRGVTFDEMDLLERVMETGGTTESERAQARQAFGRLEGTDMERVLQASILGSDERLNRYMKLYVDTGEEPPLLSKADREDILRSFDINDYIPR